MEGQEGEWSRYFNQETHTKGSQCKFFFYSLTTQLTMGILLISILNNISEICFKKGSLLTSINIRNGLLLVTLKLS